MNKYERIPEEIIDLHGYTKLEATQKLDALTQLSGVHVRIIVGNGHHSSNGPILKDTVKAYLTAKGIHYNQSKPKDGGSGALEVFL